MLRLRGFTLIELVTTMIVIGIMAVVVIGRLDFMSVFEQRGVYDKLKAGLDFARKSAVAKRRFVLVKMESGNVGFLYDGNEPEATTRSFGAANVLTLPVPDGDCGGSYGTGNWICSRSVAVIGGASLCFDAQGRALDSSCAAATTTNFQVKDDAGAVQFALTVEGETGYVR